MWRSIVIAALLPALSICPYLCMGQMCASHAVKTVANACTCCGRTATPDEAPVEPAQESDGCDCLCDGAVMAARDVTALDLLSIPSQPLFDIVADSLRSGLSESADGLMSKSTSLTGIRFSGSMLRALQV